MNPSGRTNDVGLVRRHTEHMRRSASLRTAIGVVLLCVTAVAACSESEKPSGDRSKPSIVGEWIRDTTCAERVKALDDAGLGQFAAEHAAGEGWIPGVTSVEEIDDPKRPCKGAEPLEHGHFFTSDGRFGSRDDSGEEVDDGTYRPTSPTTVVISKEFGDVTFNFTVTRDTLVLEPIMPDCTKSGCFAAQWAVAMAYPGLTWNRSG